MRGGSETDNERYRIFLEYCEERRSNWARGEQEDVARMKEKKRKEEHWGLLRESCKFLRENGEAWQQRKLKEVEKIKEEGKRDRLAFCKEK